MEIGVRMPNWVGDVVMATPFLRGLRKHFPHAKITLYLRPHLLPILEGSSWIDEQIPLEDRGRGFFQSLAEVRKRKFHFWFSLPQSLRASLFTYFVRASYKVGYDMGLGRFVYTHRAKILPHEWEGSLRPIPTDVFYLRLLETIGHPYWDRRLELPLTEGSKKFAKRYLTLLGVDFSRPLVAFNPGAGFGSSKLWPPEYFAELGDLIVNRWGAQVLLLVGPGEEKIAEQIVQKMKAPVFSTHRHIVPLRHLGAVLRHVDLLISTDSGPRHFATAFSVPVIVLCGPIHPGYTRLDAEELHLLYVEDLSCRPCHRKSCPVKGHPCMSRLTPSLVLKKVEEVLKKR